MTNTTRKILTRTATVLAIVVMVGVLFTFFVTGRTAVDNTQVSALTGVELSQIEPASGATPASGEIESIVWQAFEFNDAPVAENVVITMELGQGRISGKSACNRYTGPYALNVEARSLKITGPVAGTRMACPPELMQVETAFNAVLPNITAYRVEDGPVLTIFAGTTEVLRLQPFKRD